MKIDPVVQRQFSSIINNMCEFNPYFELLLSKEFFKTRGLSIVNEYPSLKSSIEKYSKYLRNIKRQNFDQKSMLVLLEEEAFSQEIGLNNNPQSFYTVHWNIKTLGNLIEKYHLKPKTVLIETIIERLSHGSVSNIDESIPIRTEPIIAVHYPMISESPKIIIVDGNYRTVRKYLRGDKTIDVYFVPPNVHLKAMINDISLISYKIHHNCFNIINYMIGEISDLKDLKKMNFRF
ncbi:hypothetical protein [Virgibacillus senegalensis]|uniref:hypothetical protein n=1 Tax=Virgibacillus senegalensis TaxID=1499679 RepID=UPI00069DEB2B|nr:hypothetical protein [Virgibacillus senegalensis]